MKGVEAIEAAEIHPTCSVAEACFPVEHIALQAIRPRVGVEAIVPGVESRNPVGRADPEVARLVGQNTLDNVIGQAVLSRVLHVLFSFRIETKKARFSRQPQNAPGIFMEKVDLNARRPARADAV